jgi:hypothetical protein
VEERHNLTADGVQSREVGALAKIAAVAGQREIVDVLTPAMLFGDDMFNVVCQLAVILGEQAVFATETRPAPDKVPRGGIHRYV